MLAVFKRAFSIVLFKFIIVFFLLSCSVEPEIQRNDLTLNLLSKTAKEAVEASTHTRLDMIEWETSDHIRFRRLLFRNAHKVYQYNLSDPTKARLLAYASAADSSDTLLGLYKHNLNKIFIRADRINNFDASSDDSQKYIDICYAKLANLITIETSKTKKCLKESPYIRSLEDDIYLALFIHEYTHAADVLRFEKYFDDVDHYQPGRSEVFNTLLEGNAEYLSKTLCVELKCQRGYEYLSEKVLDFSYIKDIQKRRYAENQEQSRLFRYEKGRELVEYLYANSDAQDPVEEFVKNLPDSRMVILYPKMIHEINSAVVSTINLLNIFDVFKADFPVENWLHNREVVQPPRMYRLLQLFTLNAFESTFYGEAPYVQSVLFTLEKLDLFDLYNEVEMDKSNYFIVRNLGSVEKSNEVYSKEQKHIQNATTSVNINLSRSVLPIDEFNSFSYIDKKLSDQKNDVFRTVSHVQRGQYIIIAVTNKTEFNHYDEIAMGIKKLFNELPDH